MTVIIVLGMILAVITLLLISFVHVEIVFTDQLLLTIRYLSLIHIFPEELSQRLCGPHKRRRRQ